MLHRLNYDLTELIFRVLFSLIFLGLGCEHLFSDQLIQNMMPDWLVYKRILSLIAGLILLTGGLSILLGYRMIWAGLLLSGFLIVVTAVIHVPAVLSTPINITPDHQWLWDLYQRSNLVKNLCLLGVCFHLINHTAGKYSLDYYWGLDRESGNP